MKPSLWVFAIMTMITTITVINGSAIQSDVDEKFPVAAAPTEDDSKATCCCCCGWCLSCNRDNGNNGTVTSDNLGNLMPSLKSADGSGKSGPGKSPKMIPEAEVTDPKYLCCCCCGWCLYC